VEDLSIELDKKSLFHNISKCTNIKSLRFLANSEEIDPKHDFGFFTALTGLKHLLFHPYLDQQVIRLIDKCPTFYALTNLQSLALKRVSLKKRKGLKFLTLFENLERLELEGVGTDINPNWLPISMIGELTSLRSLTLNEMYINDEDLKFLPKLPLLEELVLINEEDYLNGSFGNYISTDQHPHLTRCDIGTIPIRHLTAVSHLPALYFSYLENEDIDALALFTNLRSLECSLYKGSIENFDEVLGGLTKLENLVFTSNEVPSSISTLTNLTYLEMCLSPDECSVISTLSNLQILKIWCLDRKLPLADYAMELRSLQTIEVGGKYKDVVIDELRKGFPSVRIQKSD
jgi:hypothetical protein